MKKIKQVITGLLLASTVTFSYADCREDILETTPISDFNLHDDGTVTHKPSGLMWLRCSLGQTWDGIKCIGNASYFNFAEALAAARNHEYANHSDWRLPNRNELESILEERCSNPSINSTVFPNTPGALFWTSSSYSVSGRFAWIVNFGNSNISGADKNNIERVRLVRGR